MSNVTNFDYTQIPSPYDGNMNRQESDYANDYGNTLGGYDGNEMDPSTEQYLMNLVQQNSSSGAGDSSGGSSPINSPDQILGKVISGQSIDNMTIGSWIKSANYKPKVQGFIIDGARGYIEAMQLYIGSGGIVGGSLDIPDTISSNSFHIDNTGLLWSGANVVNKSSAPIRINPTGEMTLGNPTGVHLQLSGLNVRIQSSDYVSGAAGSGFLISAGLIEAANISARGLIRTAVFQKDVISSVGGNFMVVDSDVLDKDMTALDSSPMTTKQTTTFSMGDILRIKDGVDDEWLEVSGIPGPTNALSPGTVISEASGDVTWSNFNNVKVSDNSYATVSVSNNWSYGLKCTNFGFNIPINATITSVTIEIEMKVNTGSVSPWVRILPNNTLKNDVVVTTSEAYYSWSGTPAVWGAITPAQVNAATFGVNMWIPNTAGTVTASVDHVRITVYYTIPEGTSYGVTRDKAAVYGSNANPTWKKGATVVNYKQSGAGGIFMTASETNAPYISVYTHAGSPWSALTTRLRIGNLNGYLGYASNLYGIGIGETGKSMTYDPTNGLRITGDIIGGTIAIGSGNSIFKADSNGIYLGNATFASAPFNVDMTGNMIVSSLKRNDFQWTTIFESIDGFSAFNVTLVTNYLTLTTGASATDTAYLFKQLSYAPLVLTWSQDRRIRTRLNIEQTTSQTVWIVMGELLSTGNEKHIGFKITNNTLYGTVADGSAESTVQLSTNYANTHDLEAILIAGVGVDFYVDGTLTGSRITNNLPVDGNSFDYSMKDLLSIKVITNENAAKSVRLSYWDFWQANI